MTALLDYAVTRADCCDEELTPAYESLCSNNIRIRASKLAAKPTGTTIIQYGLEGVTAAADIGLIILGGPIAWVGVAATVVAGGICH